MAGSAAPMLELEFPDFIKKLQGTSSAKSEKVDINATVEFLTKNEYVKPSSLRGTQEEDVNDFVGYKDLKPIQRSLAKSLVAAVQVIGRNADSKQFAEATSSTMSSRAVASPHHTQESVRAPFKSLMGTEVDESVVEAACAYDEKIDTSALLAVCGYVDIPFELQLEVHLD